jgi:hypothetical protein
MPELSSTANGREAYTTEPAWHIMGGVYMVEKYPYYWNYWGVMLLGHSLRGSFTDRSLTEVKIGPVLLPLIAVSSIRST